ncbi:MAG: neurotransmitter:Na+ symporter, family, partial [Petroclostridium sp.]|nr:transporter [Clostridia bacterium]MDK2810822.1 neurotransmitter:Na+ symporter, family [Petroclostridium sp.]
EAFSGALIDKFNISRKKIVTFTAIVGYIVGLVFATGAGLYILDIVDNFINSFGIVIVGILEAIIIGWWFGTHKIREHVNPISHYPLGSWWDIAIKFITPAVLAYMIINNIIGNITKPYGGYPLDALILLGWTVVGTTLILSFVLASRPWGNKKLVNHENE